MILTCPSCGARFMVNSAALEPAGRTVRCGSCQHAWHQVPEAPALPPPPAAAEAPAEDNEPPAPSLAVPEAPRETETERLARLEAFDAARMRKEEQLAAAAEARSGRRPRAAVGWLLLMVFIGAVAGLAWFGRETIVAQVPEAARLYQLAGIDVTAPERVGEGLELRDVNSFKRLVDGQRTLLIEGSVVNTSNRERPVPALRAIITDAEGAEVSQWTFTTEQADLPPGQTTTFQTSTEDPASGVNLSLIFVDAEG